MKKVKFISALFIILFIGFNQLAYSQNKKETHIKTRFHCANGKALLEKELLKETGVLNASADINTKIVTIGYNADLTSEKKLVEAIEKIGYETEYTDPNKKIVHACSDKETPKKEPAK